MAGGFAELVRVSKTDFGAEEEATGAPKEPNGPVDCACAVKVAKAFGAVIAGVDWLEGKTEAAGAVPGRPKTDVVPGCLPKGLGFASVVAPGHEFEAGRGVSSTTGSSSSRNWSYSSSCSSPSIMLWSSWTSEIC